MEADIQKQTAALKNKLEGDNPHITISSKFLPEVKNWVTGKKYRLTDVEIEQVDSTLMDDEKTVEAEFIVRSAKTSD